MPPYKELLILFIALLVLLLIISTFGGSITQKEKFVQANPIYSNLQTNSMYSSPIEINKELPKLPNTLVSHVNIEEEGAPFKKMNNISYIKTVDPYENAPLLYASAN